MVTFPQITPKFVDLPEDPDQRREALLDILGQHICWTRDLAIARLTSRVAAHSDKDEPEQGKRLVYEQIASLTEENRELALRFAAIAIDLFMKFLLGLLANIGTDLKQDESHVIWYRLIAEIYDIDSGKTVEQTVINRDLLQFLPVYLSKWLKRAGEK